MRGLFINVHARGTSVFVGHCRRYDVRFHTLL